MSGFYQQLKWQFVLLQKNNIIGMSLVVTLIYGVTLFFFRDFENIDKVLVTLVLIDPTIIGYFFIALTIYLEINHQVLPAILVTPLNIHHFLITRILTLSFLGTLCALLLAISVKGLDFNFIYYSIGSFGICTICALLGLTVIPYASEFLKFALLSFPVFIIAVNVSQLQYLGAIEMGYFKYLFPLQGCIDLIRHAVSGDTISFSYAFLSLAVLIPSCYAMAFRLFKKKFITQKAG